MNPVARSRWAGRGLLVVAAAMLGLNLSWILPDCSALRPMRPGDMAPSFALPKITETGLTDDRIELSSMRGKVVLIDFWATWCTPCRQSMPVVERIDERYARRGLQVLSINTEGPGAATVAYRMAKKLSPSPMLLSDDGQVSAMFMVTTIPHMVALDKRGMVRMVHRGFPGERALENHLQNTVENLLAE